jgi:SHS2 domain-containing protein
VGAGFYRLIDHTADLAFEVEAPSWPLLLARATLALSDVVRPLEGPADEERVVHVEGADREEVLVALLNEAVWLYERDRFLPVSLHLKATDTSADVTLEGRRHDPEKEPPDRVVKSATYHDLRVEEGDARRPWKTTVVLDL